MIVSKKQMQVEMVTSHTCTQVVVNTGDEMCLLIASLPSPPSLLQLSHKNKNKKAPVRILLPTEKKFPTHN